MTIGGHGIPSSQPAPEPVAWLLTHEALRYWASFRHKTAAEMARDGLEEGGYTGAVLAPLYAAPAAAQPAPTKQATIQLGAYGSAFDEPGTKRAYTYKHQPGNPGAYKLGRAAAQAAKNPGGDYIDGGLSLLQALENEGFGVFQLGAEVASAPVGDGDGLTNAARDVLAERRRQVEAEGWTPNHDDEHSEGQMAGAAACYARHVNARGWVFGIAGLDDYKAEPTPRHWPWDENWWKPKNPRADLVRAGALILAEIERRDRAAARSAQAGDGNHG